MNGRVCIEPRRLADLKPAPYNPRTISGPAMKGLQSSIERFGLVQPIIVNRRTGHIVGGHQRAKALEAQGIPETDVVLVDLPEAEEKALNLALNSHAISGEWTPDALAILADVNAALPDLSSALRLDALHLDLAKLFPPAKVDIADPATPEPPANPETVLGDLYVLGRHRLLCGDSTSADAVELLLCGNDVDLIATSPPYNCDIQYRSHDDNMEADSYLQFIRDVASIAVAHLAQGRFVAWNVGVSPKSLHFDHARILRDVGCEFYRQIVWAKAGVAFPTWQFTTEAQAARKYHPNYTHEMIYLFTKGAPEIGSRCDVDDEYSRDVWHVHQSAATRDLPGETNGRRPRVDGHGGAKAAAHPAAFPLGIPSGCIKHLTAHGERVYEPFCGSGTTLVAAEQLDRICYGMEIDPAYCDVIVARWEMLTGKKAERIRA